mmetsp:Transcript_41906/g.40235  ORF Transcript_41906/g.40235 Transcript_41906/m.40235 type:complete len:83 (-) Transcript_41906:305-553(-)
MDVAIGIQVNDGKRLQGSILEKAFNSNNDRQISSVSHLNSPLMGSPKVDGSFKFTSHEGLDCPTGKSKHRRNNSNSYGHFQY